MVQRPDDAKPVPGGHRGSRATHKSRSTPAPAPTPALAPGAHCHADIKVQVLLLQDELKAALTAGARQSGDSALVGALLGKLRRTVRCRAVLRSSRIERFVSQRLLALRFPPAAQPGAAKLLAHWRALAVECAEDNDNGRFVRPHSKEAKSTCRI